MARDVAWKEEERKGTVYKKALSYVQTELAMLRNQDSGFPKKSKRLTWGKSSVAHGKGNQEPGVLGPCPNPFWPGFLSTLWALVYGLLILFCFLIALTDLTSE